MLRSLHRTLSMKLDATNMYYALPRLLQDLKSSFPLFALTVSQGEERSPGMEKGIIGGWLGCLVGTSEDVLFRTADHGRSGLTGAGGAAVRRTSSAVRNGRPGKRQGRGTGMGKLGPCGHAETRSSLLLFTETWEGWL